MRKTSTQHGQPQGPAPGAESVVVPGWADDARLRQRLRSVGMILLHCNDAGEIEKAKPPPESLPSTAATAERFVEQLVHCSPLIARIIRDEAARWGEQEVPLAVEPVPGLFLAPIALASRGSLKKGRCGWCVVALLTDALLAPAAATTGSDSRQKGIRHRGKEPSPSHASMPHAFMPAVAHEHLAALCQSARMDYELTRSLLTQWPLAHSSEAPRLIALARFLVEDHFQSLATEQAMECTGQQLAESYEEISLLYTIIGSMTVVEQPERFVTIACEELLDTLPYGWIGAQLCPPPDGSRLKQIAGRFFLAGAFPGSDQPDKGGNVAELQNDSKPRFQKRKPYSAPNPLILKLLAIMQPDAPLVLEPSRNENHAEYRALGNTILVHPVTSDGKVIGLLAAGDKHGPDPNASNVDMKLLGAIASHMAIFLENAALYDDLNAMFLGTLEALTASIDAKDRYTCGHSQRVAHLTSLLARVIGLEESVVKRMHIAGLVHDVGKIGVPESLLLKPGKLTEEEFAWIKRHPEIGYRILKDIPQLQDILPGVLYHHERWDGCGYPAGLVGEEIPQVARLIGLADSFDAMSSTRTYRSAMDRKQVLREIERCAGTQFDPDLVPVFLELDFREYDMLMIEHRAGGVSPGISSAA